MTGKSPKRTRKTTHKLSLADYIRKHSPIKPGVRLENEDKPLTKYNKIMDKIYLGNFQAAKDREFFKTKNIKAVLNCTKELPNQFANNREIEYMRIPVDDSLKEKDYELMYQYFPVIVEFIHKHVVLQKHNILVHCVAGKQRSMISVAAFLVAKHKMTPHEACKFLLTKRPEGFHYGKSLNFDQALTRYYKKLSQK